MNNEHQRPEWIDKAIAVHNVHVVRLKSNPQWRLSDTAKLLHKSIGFTCEYVKAAQWLRSHSRQLSKFESFKDAMDFIKEKELELITMEIDL